MSFPAMPGEARSAVTMSTAADVEGVAAEKISLNVNRSIAVPWSAPSVASRSVSLRPIIPAAPVTRMCICNFLGCCSPG
jgi:hypothetical protein